MKFFFGGVALSFLVLGVMACGMARGSIISQTYDVQIDTTSLQPNSGEVEFQTQLVDDPGPGAADTVQINDLNFGTMHFTQGYQNGTIATESRSDFTMEIDDTNDPFSNYAENDFDLDLFTKSITFQVTLTGPDLLGENPNTLNSFFAVELINNNGDQVLFDDNYDTVGVTAESGGPVTDNASAATITPVAIPEPSCLLLAILPIGLLGSRRRHGMA